MRPRPGQVDELLEEMIQSQLAVFKKLYMKDRQISNLIVVDDYVAEEVIEYKKVDGNLEVRGESKIHLIKLDADNFDKVSKVLNNNSKEKIIVVMIASMIFLITGLFILSVALNHLSQLFKNINEGDTPFTLENVHHIKTMSYFMIAITILSAIGNAISSIIIEQDFDLGFGFISILVFYSIAYIFEYGYELQLDSKGKIYKK